MDDGDAEVLERLLQLVLRVVGDVVDGAGAEEAAVGLRPEGVLEVAVLDHRVGDRGGDPQELLLLVDPLRDRHRVGARVDAGQDVDLLDVEQPLRLVDRHVGLGLAVAVHLDDLVLAEHAALLVDVVDDHLGPAPAVERAGGREGPGVIVERADLDGLGLRHRGGRREDEQRDRGERGQGRANARRPHCLPPGGMASVSAPRERGPRKVANRIMRARGRSTIRCGGRAGGLAAGPHEPLEPAPALDRAGRGAGLQHREAPGQDPLDLAARDRERGAAASVAEREEAGEEAGRRAAGWRAAPARTRRAERGRWRRSTCTPTSRRRRPRGRAAG